MTNSGAFRLTLFWKVLLYLSMDFRSWYTAPSTEARRESASSPQTPDMGPGIPPAVRAAVETRCLPSPMCTEGAVESARRQAAAGCRALTREEAKCGMPVICRAPTARKKSRCGKESVESNIRMGAKEGKND